MTEQKIAPVLSAGERMLRITRQVRVHALEEAALAILAGDEKSSRETDYMWDSEDCARAIRALKGTPAAAVADDAEFVTQKTLRAWTAEDWCELFERAPAVADLVRGQLVPTAAPQPSSNPGPLAAVEPTGKAGVMDDAAIESIASKHWDCAVGSGAQNFHFNVVPFAKELLSAAIAASKEGASHG